jgi:hypothetical protein
MAIPYIFHPADEDFIHTISATAVALPGVTCGYGAHSPSAERRCPR